MLAIVIPYYKIDYFEDCLASLALQTDMKFKVYIGNDGSPTDPVDLINRYSKTIDITYKSFTKNLGRKSLVQAWERCIDLTENEDWIMLLGDDDKLGSNCVEELNHSMEKVEELQINVIRFSSIVIQDTMTSKLFYHPEIENSTAFFLRRYQGNTRSSLSEYVFRKKKLLFYGFKNFPLAWYSDLLAVLESSEFGKIFTINTAVVYFRLSDNNISARNDNLKEKSIASFHFYFFLLKNKSEHFNLEQKEFLIFQLENTFLYNKKNGHFWIIFTRLYLSRFYFRRYLLYIKKLLVKILKSKIGK